MKRNHRISSAFISATMLFGIAPTMANAAPTSSQGAISTFATSHAKQLGAPTSAEECFSNGTCAQEFKTGIVTWRPSTGAKALTNSAEMQSFKQAGGPAQLGALESSSWKSSYCGQIVTTTSGKTRWLVVVDQATQPGSKIDLQSPEAKTWLAQRAKTRACFTANTAPVVKGPENINWTAAQFIPAQRALLSITDTTAYVTAADANGARVPGSAVVEVPWLKTNTAALNDWSGKSTWSEGSAIQALGLPTSNPVWNGSTAQQNFEHGTLTFSRDNTTVKTQLNTEGLKTLEESLNFTPKISGEYKMVNDRLTIKEYGNSVFVYDAQTGHATVMDQRVYNEYLKNPDRFGAPAGWRWAGADGHGSSQYLTTMFTDTAGRITTVWDADTVSVVVDPAEGDIFTINNESATVDPASINWDYTDYSLMQSARIYLHEGDNVAYTIAAGSDYHAVAGSPVFSSRWLGYNLAQMKSDAWDSYSDTNQYKEWNQGELGLHSKVSAIGLPVAAAKTVVENGVTYEVQEYSGGTVKWAIPGATAAANAGDAQITLNAIGQERVAAADARRKEIYG